MAILGLINAESFVNERFKNVRRSVFYFYPNGAAPLTGLISMLKEEVTNDPEFRWYEKRLPEQKLPTASIAANVPWYSTGITVVGGVITAATAAVANVTFTADTQYAVLVNADPTNFFRIGHLIRIRVWVSTGVYTDLIGRVNALNNVSASIPNTIGFIAVNTTAAITYNTTNNIGIDVLVVGSAFAEGSVDISSGIYNLPTPVFNLTQIFRAPFQLTGTALKTSAKYDETGPYKDQAKETSVQHMIEMEKNFMFGQNRLSAVGGVETRTTGGIMWFLQQWEAGATYNNSAATLDTDDNKRIITNVSGTLTDKLYNTYLERVFRVTNNKSNEKLVLCGSGFLNVINQLYMSRACLDASMPMTETYGMNVVKHQTPFGVIYYKSHPLMSQNVTLRNNAFFLDIQNFVYRYLDGRDTALLKNRQQNDADYRKDEWLTECGLEVRFPESHMYLQNVLDFAP
jgi:hypothetical protein